MDCSQCSKRIGTRRRVTREEMREDGEVYAGKDDNRCFRTSIFMHEVLQPRPAKRFVSTSLVDFDFDFNNIHFLSHTPHNSLSQSNATRPFRVIHSTV